MWISINHSACGLNNQGAIKIVLMKLRSNKIGDLALSFSSEGLFSSALSKNLKINYSTVETERNAGPLNEDYNIIFIKVSLRNKKRGHLSQ